MGKHPLLLFTGTRGRVGRANGQGAVGESQLGKPDSTYTVNSTACIIRETNTGKRIKSKCTGKKKANGRSFSHS